MSDERAKRIQEFTKALEERVLILDGAAGTFIQDYSLNEVDFRGEQFKEAEAELRGNNDLLQITQPDIIRKMHQAYLKATLVL